MTKMKFLTVVTLVIIQAIMTLAIDNVDPPPSGNWTRVGEKEVIGEIFIQNQYVKIVRPSQVTEIHLAFYLTSLDDVDIKTETFAVSGWWALSWNDPDLVWTPSNHSDVGVLIIYPNEIWIPTLVVSNSQTDLSAINESTIPMRITYEGNVYWRPPAILSLSCDMITTYFPFDKQVCSIQVTTSGYTIGEIKLNFRENIVLYDFFEESGEWIVESDEHSIEMITDDGLPYPKLTMEFTLKRRSFSYWLSMILPVIISSFLVLFVFYLPAASGEKMGYALTNLLAFVVILTIVTDELSASSATTSLLAVYVIIILFMAAMSVIIAAVVLDYHEAPEGQPVHNFTNKLATVMNYLCCRCPPNKGQKYEANGLQMNTMGEPTPSPDYAEGGGNMTCQEFAVLIDLTFLRLYLLSTIVVTAVFLVWMQNGA